MNSEKQGQFADELRRLLNKYSAENDSDTPDLVLAAYLISCLNAYNASVNSTKHLIEMFVQRPETVEPSDEDKARHEFMMGL